MSLLSNNILSLSPIISFSDSLDRLSHLSYPMPHTPWLKKTRDPFESPNMSKSFDTSILKETQITPVAATRSKTAHGIFERLRKNHAVVQEFEMLDGIVIDGADAEDQSASSLQLNDGLRKQNDTFDSILSHDTPKGSAPFVATQKDILLSPGILTTEKDLISVLNTQPSTEKDLKPNCESQEKRGLTLKDTQVIDTSNIPTSTQADEDHKSVTKEFLLRGNSQLAPTQVIEKSTQNIHSTPNQKFIQVPGTAEREVASINVSCYPKHHELTDPENSQIIESSFSNIKSQNGDEEKNDGSAAFPNNLLFDTLERITPTKRKDSSVSVCSSPGKQNVSTPREKEFLSSEVTEELTDIEDERTLHFKHARGLKSGCSLSNVDNTQEQNKIVDSKSFSSHKSNYSQNTEFIFSQQSFEGSPSARNPFDACEDEEEVCSDYEKEQTLDTNSRTSSLSNPVENDNVIFDDFQSPQSKELRTLNEHNKELCQEGHNIRREEDYPDYVLHQEHILNKFAVWVKVGSKIIPGSIIDFAGTTVDVSDGIEVIRVREMNILGILDIKIGDIVKWKSSKSRTCIVTGLAYEEGGLSKNTDIRCARGFNIVHIKEYRKGIDLENFEEKIVRLDEIYLSGTLFRSSTRSRLFDDVKFFKKYLSQVKKSLTVTPKYPENEHVVFSGCLFAITGTTDKKGKEIIDLKAEINSNGGTILEKGFRPFLLDSKSHLADQECNLQLSQRNTLKDYSFAAIISNGVVRTPKYLEALALGWPVLGHEFIGDCLKDSTTFARWKAYLLPAGKTRLLSGFKSVEISYFINNFEAGRTLSSQLQANVHKMNGIRLLAIQSGDEIKAGVVEFLAYCFGARSLDKPANYIEALSIIEKHYSSKDSSNDCICALYDDRTIQGMTVALDLAYEQIENQAVNDQKEELATKPKTKKRTIQSSPLITTRRRRTVKKINYNEDSDEGQKTRSKVSKHHPKPPAKVLPHSGRAGIQLLNWEWMTEVIVSGEVWPPSGNYT